MDVLAIPLSKMDRRPPSILCLGAHADDIEIGCGGTVLRLLQTFPEARITWIVFSSNSARRKEALRSAGLFLKGATSKQVVVRSYRDGFFPYQGARIKRNSSDSRSSSIRT